MTDQRTIFCRNLRDYNMRRARVHRAEGDMERLARCIRSARAWNRQILDHRATI